MRTRAANTSHGFTLLEVAVAMAIVGLGVVTLLQIFSLGLRLGGRSFASTTAVTDGREAMDAFLARRGAGEGAEEGSFDERRRWRLEVKALPQAQGALSNTWELREVSLTMRIQESEGAREVEMRTYRLVKKKGA